MIYYAGIGSRETPATALELMERIAGILSRKEHILRSGGADGADSAFERGANGTGMIYLPWKNFNNNASPLYTITEPALQMAQSLHPAWERCSQGARKLHARNCYQILGHDLDSPVKFVVCWTVGGKRGGGTGQALRLAEQLDIPIFDLALRNSQIALAKYINEL